MSETMMQFIYTVLAPVIAPAAGAIFALTALLFIYRSLRNLF